MNLDADGEGVAGRFDARNVKDKILPLADDWRNRHDSRSTKIISGKSEEEAIQTPGPIDSQQPENSKKYPSLSHYGISLIEPRACDGLLRAIYNLNKEGTAGSSTMPVTAGNDIAVTMVTIPNTAAASPHAFAKGSAKDQVSHWDYQGC